MKQSIKTIPRPLVRTNQWFIVISVLITWITGEGWILLLPLVSGLLGILVHFNPVMRLGKLFLTKHPSEYIPEDYEQQQFNQIIAVICLGMGFIGYAMGWLLVAYIFTAMVALAAFIAILGFCIGCFIRYQWIQYRHKRLSNQP